MESPEPSEASSVHTLENSQEGLRHRHVQHDNHHDNNPNPTPTSPQDSISDESDLKPANIPSYPETEERGEFECNICFEAAGDPVVTVCGHLYCWGCLARWLERASICPVCKAGVKKETVIPVYARGSKKIDPRTKTLQPRPQGQRPAPEPRPGQFFPGLFPENTFHTNFWGHSVSMTAGFGMFPGLFGMEFVMGGPHGRQFLREVPPQQAFVSRIFLMLGLMILVGLLLY